MICYYQITRKHAQNWQLLVIVLRADYYSFVIIVQDNYRRLTKKIKILGTFFLTTRTAKLVRWSQWHTTRPSANVALYWHPSFDQSPSPLLAKTSQKTHWISFISSSASLTCMCTKTMIINITLKGLTMIFLVRKPMNHLQKQEKYI